MPFASPEQDLQQAPEQLKAKGEAEGMKIETSKLKVMVSAKKRVLVKVVSALIHE